MNLMRKICKVPSYQLLSEYFLWKASAGRLAKHHKVDLKCEVRQPAQTSGTEEV